MSSVSERSPTPYSVRYPEYGDVESRVKSFTGWPGQVVGQDPRVLAVCGLFYIGSADRVRCFSCGTTLRNWQPHNDPLQVHLKVAPECSFIRAITKNHAPGSEEAGPTSSAGNEGQGSPRPGVKDASPGSKGGSSEVIGGSTGSVISGLDRGSFGPAVRGSAASPGSGSAREGSKPNSQTSTAGVASGLAKASVGHVVPGSSTNAASGLSRGGSLPNVPGSSTNTASGSSSGGSLPSFLGSSIKAASSSNSKGSSTNAASTLSSRGPLPNVPGSSTNAASGLSSRGPLQHIPGSSTNTASPLSNRGSLPHVQGSSAPRVAGSSLGPSVPGPATWVTSGMDRRGQVVLPPTGQAALTASGDLCEDCPSDPGAASVSSVNNRGNNSRRQDSDTVTSLGQELFSPAVLAVLEMGVPRRAVEAVLRDRRSRGVLASLTAVELYKACQERTTLTD